MLHRKRDFRLRPWLVPSSYAAAAIAISLVLPRLERQIFPSLSSSVSISGAIAIYSAIASGMIALTGIVFSLTFVMMQFSATAYSPRLVLWVARDPLLAHALGTFIATFVYAIAALAWVDRNSAGKVPLISSWLVIVLLLLSMGMFIALIERVGLLQVNRMLTFTGDQGRKVILATYLPIEDAVPACDLTGRFHGLHPTQTLTHHGQPCAVRSVNYAKLVELAATHDGVIELLATTGDVVLERTPILRVFRGTEWIDEESLLHAIELGEQGSFNQDPKYAIRLLVDIAIKSLSPAINDPTTATQALDQIEDLLVRLGLRRIEIGLFHDSTGELRLVAPFPSWEDFLRLAFDEIRYCGANSVQVMRRMSALISNLISVLPEERHPALLYWRQRLLGTIARSFEDAETKLEASQEDRQGLGTTRRSSSNGG